MTEATPSMSAAFGRLSSREQVMVMALVVVVLLLGSLGVTFLVSRQLGRADRRLSERREQLSQIEALEGRYRAAEVEQNRTRDRLRGNTVQLFSLIQHAATELGLKVDNLNERKTPIREAGIDEVSVDVTLKELSINKLHKFMEKMESAANNGMVKITKLKVKTGFTNEDLLDVTMTVSTYKVAAGADPAGAAGGGK